MSVRHSTGIHPQLAHRERRGGSVADPPEPVELVGRQSVLEEEQPVRLERLRQPDGLDRRQPLVDVVEKMQVGTDGSADMVEQLDCLAGVPIGVVIGARERLAREALEVDLERQDLSPDPRPAAVAAHLAADGEDARLPVRQDRVEDLGRLASVGVPVDHRRLAALPAPEVVDRHPGDLALDVPERHVDAGDGVVEDRPGPPIRVDGHHVPQVLDVGGVAADEERREILVDRARHEGRSLGERRAAEAVETGLVRVDADDDEGDPFWRGQDGANAGDLHTARRLAATGIVALQYDRRRSPRSAFQGHPSGASYATRPAAIVSRTRPARDIPINGLFFPRDRSESDVTVHCSARSNTTRSAGRALDEAGAALRRRDRSPRIAAGPIVSASTARRSGSRPGIDRRQQDAQRRLDAADAVCRLAEFDRLVDLGVRRVVSGDGVGGAVEDRGQARRGVVRRAEGRVHAKGRCERRGNERLVGPWVAGCFPRPPTRAGNPFVGQAEVMRRHVARHRQAGGLRPTDEVERGGRRQVGQMQSSARDVANHVPQDGEVPGDRGFLGRGRPATQAEHGGDEPVVGVGAGSEADVLGMVDDREPERTCIRERGPQDRRGTDGRAIVREADYTSVGELTERRELLPCPPDGDRAVREEFQWRTGRGARPPAHATGRPARRASGRCSASRRRS